MAKGRNHMFCIGWDRPVRGRAVLPKIPKIPPVRNCALDYTHREGNLP